MPQDRAAPRCLFTALLSTIPPAHFADMARLATAVQVDLQAPHEVSSCAAGGRGQQRAGPAAVPRPAAALAFCCMSLLWGVAV